MRVYRRALGLSLAAALSIPGVAWAQAASPLPGTSLDATVPALAEGEFEARITDLVEQMPPVQLGRAWAEVVDAALQRFDELTQAAAQVPETDEAQPSSLDVLPVPETDVMVRDPPAVGVIQEEGPKLDVGRFRVILKPVTASSEVVSTVRAPDAILLGVTVRAPWMVP